MSIDYGFNAIAPDNKRNYVALWVVIAGQLCLFLAILKRLQMPQIRVNRLWSRNKGLRQEK